MASFHSSRLKIERAKKHINDLHERILAFAAKDSYSLCVNKDAKTGEDILEIEIAKTLPEDFAAIIGDALHNLKSALDLMINEIVSRRTGQFFKYTRFPVADTREELVAAVKGGTIYKASKAVADFIVDVVEPYKGGNGDALCALHNLNILDKHRLLLPILHVSAVHDIWVEDETGEPIRVQSWISSMSASGVAECFRAGQIKITDYGHPTLTVHFDNGLPMQGEAVVPALAQVAESISGVLEEIEAVFLGENVSPS